MNNVIKLSVLLVCICLAFQVVSQTVEAEEYHIKKKNWLVPLAEGASVNILVNRFNWHILGAEWADVNPEAWQSNLGRGWMSDGDNFTNNLLGHPYHGSLYFNSARSLGYSYWESIPYVLSESLMWEFFGEVQPASEIDIYTTTLGGVYLGEMSNRLSKALLRNDVNKPYSLLRNTGAFILNPMGQFNSWMYKDVDRSFRSPDQRKFPIRANFSTAVSFPIREIDRVDASERAILYFQMLYGNIFVDSYSFKPFDAFKLKSWLGFNPIGENKQYYFNITSQAPLFRYLIRDDFAFSVSQHFDFMKNQVFKIGMMSVTADLIIQKNYRSWGLVASTSLGAIPFGSSNSEVVKYLNEDVEEELYKEYIYGRGLVSKVEYMIRTANYGRLISSASFWYINTNNFAQGTESVMVAKLSYDYPVFKSMSFGLEVLNYERKANYEEIPEFRDIKESYIELKVFITKSLW